MSKREPVSKKLRFEVFKRDSFACQYCGAKAPDVVLHVDHIKPVADGGKSDILNLVTSCAACNLGKGPRKLDDASEVEKQRAQLAELNERRLQLEAMMEWREGLRDLGQAEIDRVAGYWADLFWPMSLAESAKVDLAKLMRKFGAEIVLTAMDKSKESYFRAADEGGATQECANQAFGRLGGICYFIANPDQKHNQEVYYVRGILRNRLSYVNDRDCIDMVKDAIEEGNSIDDIKAIAKSVRSWTQFKNEMFQLCGWEYDVAD